MRRINLPYMLIGFILGISLIGCDRWTYCKGSVDEFIYRFENMTHKKSLLACSEQIQNMFRVGQGVRVKPLFKEKLGDNALEDLSHLVIMYRENRLYDAVLDTYENKNLERLIIMANITGNNMFLRMLLEKYRNASQMSASKLLKLAVLQRCYGCIDTIREYYPMFKKVGPELSRIMIETGDIDSIKLLRDKGFGFSDAISREIYFGRPITYWIARSPDSRFSHTYRYIMMK